MVPRTQKVDSFVVFEHVFMLKHVIWLDRVQPACHVSSKVSLKQCWRVESVIVSRSKVNDGEHKFVSSPVDVFNEFLSKNSSVSLHT